MFTQRPLHPAGYQKFQLSDAVTRIVPPLNAVQAIIQATGYAVWLRDDGVDPAVNDGIQIANGGTLLLESDTRSLRLISANSVTGNYAEATIDSAAANSDLTFTAVAVGDEWNGYTFATANDAVAGVNAEAVLNSANVNSDLTFTGPQNANYNNIDFEITFDANAGVNSTALYDSNAVNSDLTFTAPAKGTSYDGEIFTFVDDANESIAYDANSGFTLTLDIANGANAAYAKSLFDAAVAGNGSWPQWAVAYEGDGSGAVDAGTVNSSGGIDVIAPYVSFAANAFTLHTLSSTTSNDAVGLWANGPAECADWSVVEEGDGTGVLDEVNTSSANGVAPIAPSIDLVDTTFTIHYIPSVTTAADAVNMWANGPAGCADWAIADEGNGNGVLSVNSANSANGTDTIGALVHILWHSEI